MQQLVPVPQRRNGGCNRKEWNGFLIGCSGVLSVAFFVIGMACLLAGCNPNLEGSCLSYNSVTGEPYQYSYFQKTCCSVDDDDHPCPKQDEYPCYDIKVHFHLDRTNSTCYIQTGSDRGNLEGGLEQASNEFPVGESFHLLQEKVAQNVCLENNDGWNIYIAGVVFTVVTACCCLCCCTLTWKSRKEFFPGDARGGDAIANNHNNNNIAIVPEEYILPAANTARQQVILKIIKNCVFLVFHFQLSRLFLQPEKIQTTGNGQSVQWPMHR
jgi:hypothetical protein